AIFRAAFHDRHERARALRARLRQCVELLDFGKRDVHLRGAGGAARLDQLRQTVQGLRAEHHVHIWRALDDCRAFLRCDATADADQQLRPGLLQFLPAAQLREHLVLRLLADRAGVDQDHVGVAFVPRQLQTVRIGQHVGHARAVVFVHLAAVGFDEQLGGHGRGNSADGPSSLAQPPASSRMMPAPQTGEAQSVHPGTYPYLAATPCRRTLGAVMGAIIRQEAGRSARHLPVVIRSLRAMLAFALVSGLLWCACASAHPALYRCSGTQGETVFTSHPDQYRHCGLISDATMSPHRAKTVPTHLVIQSNDIAMSGTGNTPAVGNIAMSTAGQTAGPETARAAKPNPAVITVTPLHAESAPVVRSLPSPDVGVLAIGKPWPMSVLDAIATDLLPKLLEPRKPAAAAPARSALTQPAN